MPLFFRLYSQVVRINPSFRASAAVLLLCVLSACVSKPYGAAAPSKSNGIAIIGVSNADGVKPGASYNAMSRELGDLIAERGQHQVLPSIDVQKSLNSVAPGQYGAMMLNYGEHAVLSPGNIRALLAAKLPVSTALIARVSRNNISTGKPVREKLRNNAGELISDREKIVLSTIREMQVEAALINIGTGAVIWSKAYRATPATKSSYVHYYGSSFSGTLAATLANTMSNGLRGPVGPPPPSHQLTLRSLMREIARNLPSR